MKIERTINVPDPEVSIVIVDSDGKNFTIPCLESIFSSGTRTTFEVILVDNCSKDSCLPEVTKQFPSVKTLISPERQGFAKNYNLGIRNTQGNNILILNNDVIVKTEAIDRLLAALQSHPEYGMVGPKLLNPDGAIQPECARNLLTPLSYTIGQLVLDRGTPVGRWWNRFLGKRLESRKTGAVPCIVGACMFVSRRMVQEFGMLDEGYDFYFEDVEWCHRLQKHGYKIGYVAEAEVVHFGDQSLSKVREWAKKSEYLSAVRYFRQYHGLSRVGERLFWAAMLLNFQLRRVAFWLKRDQERARIYARLFDWLFSESTGE